MCNSGSIKFEPGGEVAHGGEAEPGNDGIFDDVDELVDAAGLETGAQVDASVDCGGGGGGKAPVGAGDGLARAVGGVADGEDVARVIRIRDRILSAADAADDDVAEGPVRAFCDGGEVVAQEAGDWLAVIGGDGCIEVQTRRVPLPAERGDGVALAQCFWDPRSRHRQCARGLCRRGWGFPAAARRWRHAKVA